MCVSKLLRQSIKVINCNRYMDYEKKYIMFGYYYILIKKYKKKDDCPQNVVNKIKIVQSLRH